MGESLQHVANFYNCGNSTLSEKELLSVKLSKHSQSKGGKHPASEKQKSTSRMCILANEPWRSSTGPRTALGRRISSQNSTTHGLYRTLQVLPRAELERLWGDPFYRQVERRLRQLQAQRDRESVVFKQWLKEF